MARTTYDRHGCAMSTTPPEAPEHPRPSSDGSEGPRVSPQEMRDLARLRRGRVDRRVAGVCSGLAQHFDIDPAIVRVAFVVLIFFGGVGLVLYGVCWLLIPDEGTGTGRIALDDRSRAIALIIAGVIAALVILGVGWGGPPWPVVIVVGLVAWWLISRRKPQSVPPANAVDPVAGHGPGIPSSPTSPAAAAYPSYQLVQRPRPGLRPLWTVVRLMALALIVLGIINLLGVSVVASAYPALALGITGLGLLYAAFRGRIRGLVPIGLLCALVLVASTAAEQIDPQRTEVTPMSAAVVQSSYDMGNGRLVIDLTQVDDLSGLDGRIVTVHGGLGDLEVIVPPGLNVDTAAAVTTIGGMDVFGRNEGGADHHLYDRQIVSGSAPTLHLDLRLRIGQITVLREGENR